jgi:hypothetical protein
MSTAVAAGVQVMALLGAATTGLVTTGWHGSKVLGVFGAAAAAGVVLHLTAGELAGAFGIAASDAGGTMEDNLVREVLGVFFGRLIGLARQADDEPPERCLSVYLDTVGWELAANRGFLHGMWGALAPAERVRDIEELTGRLPAKAQEGGISVQVTVGDIAAAIWALRGIVHTSGEVAPDAWRRHAAYVLAGFRAQVDHTAVTLTARQIAAAVAASRRPRH